MYRLEKTYHSVADFFTARRILLLALVPACLWGLLFILLNDNMYRDVAHCYAWYAREFSRGIWNHTEIAGLPPLHIFLGGLLARITGIEAYRGLMLLSLGFYLLTVFPLYGMLKTWLPEKTAAWGCLLFLWAPKVIRFAGMGLLEAVRDFFLVSSLYFLFRLRQGKRSAAEWLLMGAALAGLSLARGEGLLMGGLIGLAIFIRPLAEYRDRRKFLSGILLPACVIGITALAVLSPRLTETWRTTGYPVTDARCIGLLRALPGSSLLFQAKAYLPTAAAKKNPNTGTDIVKQLRIRLILPLQALRGGYELYVIFAALGVWALRRKWRGEYTLLLSLSLLFCIGIGIFSLAYRYFIFLIPLLMVFTLNGIRLVLQLAARFHLEPAAAAVIGVTAVLQTLNGLTPLWDRDGRREKQMARHIRDCRAGFLPPGEDRKLKMADDCLPEIVYHCNESRLYGYGIPRPPMEEAAGFDLLIVKQRNRELCEKLRKRKDLQAVRHPYEREYLLMQPAGGKK